VRVWGSNPHAPTIEEFGIFLHSVPKYRGGMIHI
jgi:hypothetical protein